MNTSALDQPAGASRSSSPEAAPTPSADTGSGAPVPAETDVLPMAELSTASPAAPRARPNTGSDKRPLSRLDRLQIAQQAILNLALVGIQVDLDFDGTDMHITLHQVRVIDGNLVYGGDA